MSHFYIKTPFGNFAGRIEGEHGETVRMYPLGSLTEVPINSRGHLDNTALRAEAERQVSSGEFHPHSNIWVPQVAYSVNGKVYRHSVTVEIRGEYAIVEGGEYAGYSEPFTAAARKKFGAWVLQNKDSIFTPERLQAHQDERHDSAVECAGRKVDAARVALEEAEMELSNLLA